MPPIGNVIDEIPGIISVHLFSPEECAFILSEAEQSTRWDVATVHGGVHDGANVSVVKTDVRSADVIGLSSLPSVSPLFDLRIKEVILPRIDATWKMHLTEHAGAQLIRYAPGGFYLTHSDSGPHFPERQFSVVCYLNEDVEGGATSFPEIEYTVIPQCGKAIVFPSEYPHQAQPVTSGLKYAIVTWIVGEVPVPWI